MTCEDRKDVDVSPTVAMGCEGGFGVSGGAEDRGNRGEGQALGSDNDTKQPISLLTADRLHIKQKQRTHKPAAPRYRIAVWLPDHWRIHLERWRDSQQGKDDRQTLSSLLRELLWKHMRKEGIYLEPHHRQRKQLATWDLMSERTKKAWHKRLNRREWYRRHAEEDKARRRRRAVELSRAHLRVGWSWLPDGTVLAGDLDGEAGIVHADGRYERRSRYTATKVREALRDARDRGQGPEGERWDYFLENEQTYID